MDLQDEQLDHCIRGGAPHDAAATCTQTPEFDLGRLLALGADSSDDEAVLHLAECGFCRAMAQDAAEPAGEMLMARMNRAWPAKRRWVPFAGAGLAIAAAAALFLVLSPRVQAPAAFEMEGPLGGLTQVRADVAGSDVFLPESQVRVVLRPVESGKAQPAVAAYVSDAGGALRRLPDAVVERRENGSVLLKGEGRALFGAEPGRKKLYVVVASDPGRLEKLDGAPVSAGRGEGDGTRWYEAEVEYRLTP